MDESRCTFEYRFSQILMMGFSETHEELCHLFLDPLFSTNLSCQIGYCPRPFPDYSPKKPTIRNAELVYQISTAIKLRRYEPLHRVLKPYKSKFSGFCQTGKMVEAHKLFHEMLSKGLKPDVVTYTALIDSYCKANNITKAMKLMEDMRVAGFPPDTLTYTTLMDAYSKSEEMVKAHKLVREMLYKWLPPTVVTFNVLMNGFCISRMLEDGERLLKGMLEKGIMPNATTYNCLMKQHSIRNNMVTIAIYKEGNMKTTLELCDEAIR
ncbi:hypothetical protein JRO89_XS05G0063000 [Xanthoceras sorbifolium]|uniref:Pentatricopeptide repeat-containing protein n=1 Tax=Xanthoceras sorbifolium TaxID=99658 RepID=A0ABQ8I135_9ROSI|nr:hypothetical protein JRO89_XS05G0063000 [Xanthoceras sorbifolium]